MKDVNRVEQWLEQITADIMRQDQSKQIMLNPGDAKVLLNAARLAAEVSKIMKAHEECA